MSDRIIKSLRNENRVLKREISKFKKLSHRDDLTGLWNKIGFKYSVLGTLSMVRREKSRLCLGVFDLDGFKQFNDKLGHKEGDKVLAMFADVLVKHTRLGDVLSRWGGDEFVVALPLARLSDALDVGERIRDYVEKKYKRNKYPITVSGAFSEVSFHDFEFKKKTSYHSLEKIYERLFRQADKKLLSIAKRSKNKIV